MNTPQMTIPFRDVRHDAERIATALCAATDHLHTPEEFFGRWRPASLSRLRMVAAYILRYHMGHSCADIGRAMGRNHATVIYCMDTMIDQAPRYADLRHVYRAACAAMGLDMHRQMMAGGVEQTNTLATA